MKMSRRFLPLIDWVCTLQELALASQYPTYSSLCKTYGFGFRSECVGMAVTEWIGNRSHEQLALIAVAAGSPFVEAAVHNIARRLRNSDASAQALGRDGGSAPDDRDGYAPWDFMGTDRRKRYPQFLWHDSAEPDDYHELARHWGLPYRHEDFVDPNQGFGMAP